MNNYYEVEAKCGHVGRNKYVPIRFAVVAESGSEAASMVRQFPRVKHDHKYAILNVTKIDYERYLEINAINNNNPYLKCKSKHEQKLIDGLELQLEEDNHKRKIKYKKERCVKYKIKKNRLRFLTDVREIRAYLAG